MAERRRLSRSAVGFAGLIFFVYSINFLWAPLIDRLRVPVLTAKFGHRKAWILTMQIIILLSLLVWSTTAPATNIFLVMAVGVVIATCSATQDITIDALRIEQIRKEDSGAMAAGASIAVIGWWTGFKLGGMITLLVADKFELMGMENYWQMTFLVIGLLVIATNIGLLFIPGNRHPGTHQGHRPLHRQNCAQRWAIPQLSPKLSALSAQLLSRRFSASSAITG